MVDNIIKRHPSRRLCIPRPKRLAHKAQCHESIVDEEDTPDKRKYSIRKGTTIHPLWRFFGTLVSLPGSLSDQRVAVNPLRSSASTTEWTTTNPCCSTSWFIVDGRNAYSFSIKSCEGGEGKTSSPLTGRTNSASRILRVLMRDEVKEGQEVRIALEQQQTTRLLGLCPPWLPSILVAKNKAATVRNVKTRKAGPRTDLHRNPESKAPAHWVWIASVAITACVLILATLVSWRPWRREHSTPPAKTLSRPLIPATVQTSQTHSASVVLDEVNPQQEATRLSFSASSGRPNFSSTQPR